MGKVKPPVCVYTHTDKYARACMYAMSESFMHHTLVEKTKRTFRPQEQEEQVKPVPTHERIDTAAVTHHDTRYTTGEGVSDERDGSPVPTRRVLFFSRRSAPSCRPTEPTTNRITNRGKITEPQKMRK